MNDKVELLKCAVQKISDNRGYIGYYLKRYCSVENIDDTQLIKQLNCNYEDFLKLGLCLIPEILNKDFLSRINNISNYTHISALEIIHIVKQVSSLEHFSDIPSESILMAARDKASNKKDNNSD